jgi:hypothetical protein
MEGKSFAFLPRKFIGSLRKLQKSTERFAIGIRLERHRKFKKGLFFYSNSSFSIYKKSEAIVTAGKITPIRGTNKLGKTELIYIFIYF